MKRLAQALASLTLFACPPALAPLALPGAVAPAGEGAVVHAPSPAKAQAQRPAGPPGPSAVVGKPLFQNGASGNLLFSLRSGALRIDRLSLVGEVISDPTQQCRIEVVSGAPIETKMTGRPDGLLRYEADIPACPFEFDVLEGAVLAPPTSSVCVFKEADCQASPAGLWGPEGSALIDKATSIEHDRGRAEAAMRAGFRALDESLKDPIKATELAREQSGFSSDRETTCQDYALERKHGFCATRLTEARAAFLQARLEAQPKEPEKKKKHHKKVGT
jgi:hypothetical protein